MIPPRLWPYLIGAGVAALLFLALLKLVGGVTDSARAERDVYWRGEIAKANEQTALAKLLQEQEKNRLETALAAQTEQFQQQIDELEHANEALPNDSACGLDADRVRLLRKP